MKEIYYTVYKTINCVNNKIYIGVHKTCNINDNYIGSGINLCKDVTKYGKEQFTKEILHVYNNPDDMLKKERELVNKTFIKREDTYNIILGGGDISTYGTVNIKDIYGNKFTVSKEDSRYLSGELVGVTKGSITVKDKDGNTFNVSVNDPRYLNGELIFYLSDMLPLKDENGSISMFSKEDSRYLSGELVGVTKGSITVKDKDGNTFNVSVNDPRYLNGELVPLFTGLHHSEKTKQKISNSKKGKYLAEQNSQFGTCWIYNKELELNRKIPKDKLDEWLNNNWKKGRKMKYKNKKHINTK